MPTISICMIVKNEEKFLSRCLKPLVDFADEIIVVDTGSTDKTKEIANGLGAKVFDFEWCGDFSKARNYSFSKASSDYLMWLDADDVVELQNVTALTSLKQTLDPSVDVVMMRYRSGDLVYFRERLLKRVRNYKWEEPVHEAITPSGKVIYSDITIDHRKENTVYTKRNLNIYRKMKRDNVKFSPRARFYYARELMYHGYYKSAVKEYTGFLEGGLGWIENNIEACRNLGYCYMRLGRKTDTLAALFRSFCYDRPRAELCCDIAEHFLSAHRYETSKYWYLRALECPNSSRGGFDSADAHALFPYIGLSACCYNLGEAESAKKYHLLAKEINPLHPSVIHNDKLFFNTP